MTETHLAFKGVIMQTNDHFAVQYRSR